MNNQSKLHNALDIGGVFEGVFTKEELQPIYAYIFGETDESPKLELTEEQQKRLFQGLLKVVIKEAYLGDPKAKQILRDIKKTMEEYFSREELEPLFEDILDDPGKEKSHSAGNTKAFQETV